MWDSYLFYFITHGVLLVIVGSIGLVGNILTILVLSRPQMKSSTISLLLALAVCDSIYIMCSLILYGSTTVHHYTKLLPYYYYHIYPHITPYVYLVIRSAQTMSVYLTLIVTLERWVAVCHPLQAKAVCTISRARRYIVITAIFSFAYNIPRYWEKKVNMFQRNGTTYYTIGYNRELYTDMYIKVYLHWMSLLMMYVIPFVTLAILNFCIIRQTCLARAKRAVMTSIQRRENKLTAMLLVIVSMFFICNLLPFVHTSIFVFYGKKYYDLKWTSELIYVSNLLLTFNHSVNFVIYTIYGKKLRRGLKEMFCTYVRRHIEARVARNVARNVEKSYITRF